MAANFQKFYIAAKRLFPSYLLCFLPFLVFGTKNDLRLIFWKVAVVGAGLLAFHYTRKSMFPYIDLHKSLHTLRHADDSAKLLPLAVSLLAEALIIAALAFAIVIAVAEGL